MEKDLNNLKEKLLKEKKLLEGELSAIGRKSKDVPGDWDAVPPETEPDGEPDKNIAADVMENFEEAVATESELEQRMAQINTSLANMENGNYGICKICSKEIEVERLNANPAAATCIEHRSS